MCDTAMDVGNCPGTPVYAGFCNDCADILFSGTFDYDIYLNGEVMDGGQVSAISEADALLVVKLEHGLTDRYEVVFA